MAPRKARDIIVIFDVEGVLVDGEFLPEVAKLAGTGAEVQELTQKGISGQMSWEAGLKRRVELIKGVTHDQCVTVSNSLPLMRGAVEMAENLKKMDCIMVGISGGFSLLTNRVKSALALDHVFSNELVFHDSKLIGYGLLVNANKAQILDTAFGRIFDERKKVAVVDGANDIDLFGVADLRIAFNAQKVVRDRADVLITEKDLRVIPEIVRKFKEQT